MTNDRDHGIASGLAHEAMLQQARQPTPAPHAADNTTISAAALVARIASLEAQLGAAQKVNTDLIKRIVELEHERDEARTTIRIALQRLYDADSGEPKTVLRVLLGVKHILRRGGAPAETPPPIPAEDALSSVASQLAVMIIQERLAAGHTITFASDLAPPTQEGGDDE